jgi:hypothetical protein
MGECTFNGKTYKGNNISIINNKVYIDDKLIEDEDSTSLDKINITFTEGSFDKIEVDGDVDIKGNVIGNVSANGSINCNDISGNASSGGSMNCDDISGNASSGGSMSCDDISGNANAGGSIKRS